MRPPHTPVLTDAVADALLPALRSGGVLLDGTVGAGGHALHLLPHLDERCRYVGVDRDADALALAQERLAPYRTRVELVHGRFGELSALAQRFAPEGGLRAVLLDVGVSSMQLERPERGFSFAAAAPLDMRMDRSSGPTAAELVRTLPEGELADVIYRYGEERLSRRIARAIARARRRGALTRTDQLADIIAGAVPRGYERGRIHPATRTFQALRIAVNDELGELERALAALPGALAAGGRCAVISFHSLEDRLVKHALRGGKQAGLLRVLTKKPIAPSPAEVRANRRARGAKLRAAERTDAGG